MPPINYPYNKSMFGPPCQALCGHRLNRWHMSCFTCRIRRVWMGKVPSKGKVSVYVMYIQKDLPFKTLRRILLKRLLTLCEVLAT